MDCKPKASDELFTLNGVSGGPWVRSTESLVTPPCTRRDDEYSPRNKTGCPSWEESTVKRRNRTSPQSKRINLVKHDSCDGTVTTDYSKSELQSSSSLAFSPSPSEYSDSASRPKRQALFPPMMLSPDKFPSSEYATERRARRKRARDSDDEDRNYVDVHNSDDEELESPVVINRSERDEIIFVLSREKAKRMAQAIKVPQDTKMGDEEKSLYLDLATRGCYPVLPSSWKKDFATLPESLFPTEDEEVDESNFPFAIQKASEFYAITALHDILRVPGLVRDCRFLEVFPEEVIKKAIRRYLRWAITDAGVKKTPRTAAIHTIVTQRVEEDGNKEEPLHVVQRVLKRLKWLADKHKDMYLGTKDPYWPTLVGFCLCGPIVTILSMDTDPRSATWKEENLGCHAKYMGQFDMSEDDQDVWNSLALSIAVLHIRRTMTRLADHYPYMDGVAQRRRPGDDTEDEDL
ncbi:hypothetical protein F1880_002627 [Penicillium rolfsii]|nr:hypothetical protein F1880_002627 [Penicillium rolfsii]